jgi:hypothetical protein
LIFRALNLSSLDLLSLDLLSVGLFEDDVMVAAVNNSPSVLAPPQSKTPAQSAPPSASAAFQQSLDQYLQNTASGAGGAIGANASQTLSSDLMSSLLQMQS